MIVRNFYSDRCRESRSEYWLLKFEKDFEEYFVPKKQTTNNYVPSKNFFLHKSNESKHHCIHETITEDDHLHQYPQDEDSTPSTPPHHLDEPFFNAWIPASPSEDDEQDFLVMGYPQDASFLDIRDKDFFNVATALDDTIGNSLARTMLSQLEDSILCPVEESVEEFYSGGIETDYF